ncbi:MAG: 16S rRNA (cytosine(1402)-N(4))-methyltransferase RsmH [Ignavibacteriae bacterium]|nr:16S rRNA (cytosine(1402)-N(4))-methyltransferase RsmH [Ignavibacteriota bacterium]NOG97524.1 16S rRNA (cytosine(1402)-N(4))-methyltransferase RsmH [Ignavibacteriota bacterium]
MQHVPVLLEESLKYLVTEEDGKYFDGTMGFGGHSSALLNKVSPNAVLIGTDKDKQAFQYLKNKFIDDKRVKLYNTGFTDIDIISKIEFIDNFDGILVDLGVSSFQLDDPNSGFTYREDAPLDLRMDKEKGISAAVVLTKFAPEELTEILFKYGEEKNARKIVRAIVESRNSKTISTTKDLREIIEPIVPQRFLNKSLSRVFQALRIYVNDELEELKIFLKKAVDLLSTDGRIVVISFHSLEDRIVKEVFKYESLSCVCPPEAPICVCDKEQRLKILTRKPVVPTDIEIKNNKRSRSAKLRAAQKI